MSEPRYRVRLVIEGDFYDSADWTIWEGRTLCDPTPNKKIVYQAFDDALQTLDAKERADALRESDY